jgi:hypothetical protein
MEVTQQQLDLIKTIPFLLGQQSSASLIYGRAYLAGSQSPATSTPTKVALDTKSFASGITCDLTNHRFTCITAGYYFVNGQVTYDSYVTGKNIVAEIYVNGTQMVYSLGAGFNSTSLATQRVSDLVHLNAGDYVELYTFHNFGSSALLEAGSIYNYLDIFLI